MLMKSINALYGLNAHFLIHKLQYAVYIVTTKPLRAV